MTDTLYDTLGVSKSAGAAEIKSAYKKLVKKHHPDLNPGDKEAAETFKEIAAAYDLLKDPEKRAKYDAGEIDAQGHERPERQYYRDFAEAGQGGAYHTGQGYDDFDDLSGVFQDLFGRRARASTGQVQMRGRDALYALDVDFLDAALGGSKRITLPDGNALDLKIPKGIDDGQTIRLQGKGAPGYGGGPAGDALVTIAVKSHPFFRRENKDIMVELPITLDESVLGARINVPTIDGSVKMRIPGGSSSGKVLRLKGKGIAGGDQKVTLRVVLPETIDSDLSTFMETWRETHAYNPREALS